MTDRKIASYGSWTSPITSDFVASSAIRLGEIVLDGDDIYWSEMRPSEGGRYVIVRRTPEGTLSDITPPGFNVRTRVHEYGGAPFLVHDGVVYFSNFADQRLYRQAPGEAPSPITPSASLRYADGVFDAQRGRVICIREDHSNRGFQAQNTIVAVDAKGEGLNLGGQVLVIGNDFYASPRISPDGTRLAWLTWNHPNMPWDGAELWVGEFQPNGTLAERQCVAGGWEESVFQPEWSPDGTLTFVSDRTGWWNLYRWQDGQVKAVVEMEAEFGAPQWAFGLSTYGYDAPNRIVCAYTSQGTWRLASIDAATGALSPIETPYTSISQLQVRPGRALFVGGSPTELPAIVQLDLSSGRREALRRTGDAPVGADVISVAQPIEFPTENGQTAHALYYAPRNPAFAAPEGELPPLLVISHGGPTGATSAQLSLSVQYWTSRGFAVLDVNYGGSTGYGRAYRKRLNGQWGVVDVDDCANAARYLVSQGLADPKRLIIRGGSAGGYTTLAALTFRDVFTAGASYYGVSDLEMLAKETHKFESRYLDYLVGPYPERRDLYLARSPLAHAERLACPLIFFQGLEDEVVPPNQAERMVEIVRQKGYPVAYVPFAGEQHGFRRAENIKRALDAELWFYSRIFGFELAEVIEPVEIANM